jgi:hypothetical protein
MMDNYKPYAYLYKHVSEPAWLKSCFVVMIPAGEKLVLRSGDPSTVGDQVFIRYSIAEDSSQTQRRQEYFENQFSWNGNDCEVEVLVGDGSSTGGGRTTIKSQDAELD